MRSSRTGRRETCCKPAFPHSPDLIDVMLVMASIGFDKVAASSPVDAYNADTIKYAKEAIQKIEAGAASTQYGAWSYTYKTKGNAVAWMNYIIGYIMYSRQNMKKEALPFLYKAAQNTSGLKKQSIPYQLIGDYYKDDYNRIDERRATLASEAKGKTPEEIKPLADKAKELLRLQKAYAERMFDAYARAYILAGKDNIYRAGLYNDLGNYTLKGGIIDVQRYPTWRRRKMVSYTSRGREYEDTRRYYEERLLSVL